MSDINIRSLAKELNLSIGTVSKALRNSFEISDETKRKVFDLAKKHNYLWLQDFIDDEVTVTSDLYEVIRAFGYQRRPSA